MIKYTIYLKYEKYWAQGKETKEYAKTTDLALQEQVKKDFIKEIGKFTKKEIVILDEPVHLEPAVRIAIDPQILSQAVDFMRKSDFVETIDKDFVQCN
jgi:hypothetical protein